MDNTIICKRKRIKNEVAFVYRKGMNVTKLPLWFVRLLKIDTTGRPCFTIIPTTIGEHPVIFTLANGKMYSVKHREYIILTYTGEIKIFNEKEFLNEYDLIGGIYDR